MENGKVREVLRLLSSDSNLRILSLLSVKPLNPRELARLLDRDETDVSRRLKALERAGLVEGEWHRVKGRNVKLYRLRLSEVSLTFKEGEVRLSIRRPTSREATPLVSTCTSFSIPEPGGFVGRREELKLVDDPSRHFVVVKGLPGIGKTSLAAYYARVKGSEGYKVFWHTFSETDSLDHLMLKLALFLASLGRRRLAVYINEARGHSIPYEVLRRELEGLGKLLLVFDSYERCRDRRVDRLLEFLASRRLRGVKTLVTTRNRPKLPLSSPGVLELELTALRASEVREFFEVRGLKLDSSLLTRIYMATLGHPLSLELVYSSIAARGLDTAMRALEEAEPLKGFWRLLYDSLSPEEREVVRILSFFDEPVPLDLLSTLYSGKHLLRILYLLEDKMLVKAHPDGYYLHELVRRAVRRLQVGVNPARYYRAAAAYYALRRDEQGVLKQLNYALKAGDVEEGMEAVKRHAKLYDDPGSLRLSDVYQELLRRLLSLAERRGARREDLGYLYYELGAVGERTGNLEQARNYLKAALLHLVDDEVRVRALIRFARTAVLECRLDEAEELMHEAKRLAEGIKYSNISLYSHVYSVSFMLNVFKGDIEGMRDDVERMNRILDVCMDAYIRARILLARGVYYVAIDDYERAVRDLSEARRLYAEGGHVLRAIETGIELASALACKGDYEEALAILNEAIGFYEEQFMDALSLLEVYTDKALILLEVGRLEEAEEHCLKALKLRGLVDPNYLVGFLVWHIAWFFVFSPVFITQGSPLRGIKPPSMGFAQLVLSFILAWISWDVITIRLSATTPLFSFGVVASGIVMWALAYSWMFSFSEVAKYEQLKKRGVLAFIVVAVIVAVWTAVMWYPLMYARPEFSFELLIVYFNLCGHSRAHSHKAFWLRAPSTLPAPLGTPPLDQGV